MDSGHKVGSGRSRGLPISLLPLPMPPFHPQIPGTRGGPFSSETPSGTPPPLGQAPRWFPGLLTFQVVSGARRRGTPRPRCLVPRRGRMECRRLRSFDRSAFRHGCFRVGGGSGVLPLPLNNNSAAGSLQHPGGHSTATSGSTTSPEPTSAPRAVTLSCELQRLLGLGSAPPRPPRLARSRPPSNRETSQGPRPPHLLPYPASWLRGACAFMAPASAGVTHGLRLETRISNYPEVRSQTLKSLCPGSRKCPPTNSWHFMVDVDSNLHQLDNLSWIWRS